MQHINFWSKRILNERQQVICIKMQIRAHRRLNMAFCCIPGVVRKGMENGSCVPCKAKNRHQRWHHSIGNILFNQHIFSSYIISIIPKYVDRCTIKILFGGGGGRDDDTICTSSSLRTTFAPKPLLLLSLPRPSPLSTNKNFGRRLDIAWTLFCIKFCSY